MFRKTSAVLTVILGMVLAVTALPGFAVGHHEQHRSAHKKSERSAKALKVTAKRKMQRVAVSDMTHLKLYSSAAMVLDQSTGLVLFEKNANAVLPIASITKLMTAMVALDMRADLNETLVISEEDVDLLKGTHSRLAVGTLLTREEMLRLALMSSENRAASALSRHYPGGRPAFVAAMNRKAMALGLQDTHFMDPTGLNAANVSSAHDLAAMVSAAQRYPLIREFSTSAEYEVPVAGRMQTFRNTNSLVRSSAWDIGVSKTGFINEAGRCLVMQAWLANKPVVIVLLDSIGKMTRLGDANRIKSWVENSAGGQRRVAG
jgi:D-alanyl-D-alanine endopeptidase (penicillin-binding protein 7)